MDSCRWFGHDWTQWAQQERVDQIDVVRGSLIKKAEAEDYVPSRTFVVQMRQCLRCGYSEFDRQQRT